MLRPADPHDADQEITVDSVFEDLHLGGRLATQEGRYAEAQELFAQAWERARQLGNQALADRVFCNKAAVTIELGEADSILGELRKILMRNSDQENCRLAAYNIARAYEYLKDYKKGLFYARIAKNHTDSLENPSQEWVASGHNQIGNFLVADSLFEEAVPEYETALQLTPESSPTRRAVIERNLGYCKIIQKQFRAGFTLLYRSLRTLRSSGPLSERMFAHLDLSFAHLEVERYATAHRHAERGLAVAQQLRHADATKNALYLLGESANLMGDEALACFYFDQLQVHFPDTPFLTDFLLAIDVRTMINLRA
jgi:Tfp pilus assembly protein PilF